jgi:hypothetical protein
MASLLLMAGGCQEPSPPPYGVEGKLVLPGRQAQTWAVAPAISLSGQREVDELLQADLLYVQLQQVRGLTVIPVNRVVQAMETLGINRLKSEQQAVLLADTLNCDGVVVVTVSAFDPYDPPKLGASIQLFRRGSYARPEGIDPRDLARSAGQFVQVVGMYDAANGSVRDRLETYAAGRNDPAGPYGAREYLVDMDRYCGFVYHCLIAELLGSPQLKDRAR